MTMKKSNNNSINDEKFRENRRKRKTVEKTSAGPVRKASSSRVKQVKKADVKKTHTTAFIVISVLASIIILFTSLLLFAPGFKTTVLKHVLMSISYGSNLSNNDNPDASLSDGIHHTFEGDGGKQGSLHKDVYTFLATGTDFGGNLTDVIMIAKLDTEKDKIDILQIPRDTYVKLNSKLIIDDKGNISRDNFTKGYEAKINSVYSQGKNLAYNPLNKLIGEAKGKGVSQIEKLCKSKEYSYLGVTQQQLSRYLSESDGTKKKELLNNMQRNFGIKYLSTLIYYSYGIPIDYHAQVNTAGFRNIVDAVGGVELYVPQDMYHYDPTQNLFINLKKGQQHLDGDKAEQFVRFRGYAMGDIARIDAQKTFINAFLDKVCSVSIVSRISPILAVVQENLYTNLTLQEISDFALKALDMDLSTGFTMTTLPGAPVDVYRGGMRVSYYTAIKKDVASLVNENFNKYDTTLPDSMFNLIELKSESVPVTIAPSTSDNQEPSQKDESAPDGQENEASGDNSQTSDTTPENAGLSGEDGNDIENDEVEAGSENDVESDTQNDDDDTDGENVNNGEQDSQSGEDNGDGESDSESTSAPSQGEQDAAVSDNTDEGTQNEPVTDLFDAVINGNLRQETQEGSSVPTESHSDASDETQQAA